VWQERNLNMTHKVVTMLITLGLAATAAQADMTYSPFLFGGALDASGNPIVNGTYVMVLDLDGNWWQGNSYAAQSPGANNAASWLWDPNDMLMDRGEVDNGEAYPFKTIVTAQKPASYTANVDHYYLIWFDTPFNAGAAGPGVGVHYGVADLGTVGSDPGTYTTYPDGGNAALRTISGLTPSWHNNTLAADVNGDGSVTGADATLIINKLNAEGSHALATPGDPLPGAGGYYWDVTDDATPYLSPLDALMVINQVNSAGGAGLVSMPIPEPTSIMLLGLGGLSMLRSRRRTNIE
jgi:hypothetical protein